MTYSVIPVVGSEDGQEVYLTNAAKFLREYYKVMQDEDLIKYAYFDGSADTEKDFISLSTSPMVLFSFIFDDTAVERFPIGHVCITNMTGYCSMVHFNILRKYHPKAVEVAKEGFRFMSQLKRKNGTVFIHDLIGITPVTNKAAIWFSKKVGFKRLCVLNKPCHMFYEDRYVDGVLSVLKLQEEYGLDIQRRG